MAQDIHEESLRDLVGRVVDDGKAYAKAEVAVAKTRVLGTVNQIKPAAIMIVVAVLLVQAALTVLAAALGMVFAIWIGTAGGLAVGAVIVLLIAGLLVKLALGRLKGIS